MKINHTTSSSYSVIDSHNGKYHLVKIIGEYEGDVGKKEAYKDMVNLMNKDISEDEIEKKRWRDIK